MKLLAFIPIVVAILLSPMILESVHAEHIDGYDDIFYYKELDNTAGTCEGLIEYNGNGFTVTSTITSTKYCSVFKVFDTLDVDGKEHSGFMGGSHTPSTPTYIRAWIYDGAYTVTNSTQFPTDGFGTQGAGLLFTNSGAGNTYVDPYTPDLSASTLDQVTNFIIVVEDLGSGSANGYVGEFEVEDLGVWYFASEMSNSGQFGDDGTNIWEIQRNVTGTDLDYGQVRSYNPVIPNAPTSLTATAVNDTAITVTWTDPTRTNTQQPLTEHIHIQIQNGTGSDYYWTASGMTTNGTGTFTTNDLEAGHTYNFRAVADAIGMFGAFSNEDNATTTGSEAEAQTFRTSAIETYASAGIVDNSFYATEYYSGGYNANQLGGGNCDDTLQSSSKGWWNGFSGTSYGVCYMHIKSFPTSLVDGVEWLIGDSTTRTIDPVYYHFKIYDGNVEDVMDSSVWLPYMRTPFVQDIYPDTDVDLITGSAGILYSYEAGSFPDVASMDLSSALLSEVTMMTIVEDYDATNNDNASTGIWWIQIDGLYKFFFPLGDSTDYQIEYMIEDSTHDTMRLSAFTPPKAPSSITGVKDGNTADLTYTVPSFLGGTSGAGLNVYRYCSDVDSDYSLVGSFAGLNSGTFTDNTFQQSLDSVTLGVTPYYSYDFSTQGTPDPTWADNVYYDVNLTTEKLDWDTKADNTSDVARANPVDVMGDEWLIEFDITFEEVGNTGANAMFIGGTSSVSGNVGNTSVDFMGIEFQQFAGGHEINHITKDGATFTRNTFDFKQAVGDKLWVSLERHDATTFSVSLFNAETRQAEDLIESIGPITMTGTYSNIITQIISNHNQNVVEGSDSGEIDNWNVWYGQDLADVSHTPVYSDTANGACVYKLSAYNDWGSGWNATSSAVTVGDPNAPTFTEITTHTALADWSISGETDVTGYALQYSFDDSTWLTLNENTSPDTSTNHSITGIDPLTTVYVRWADVIGGVVQTYSSSGSFTTLGVQAGGGGPGPTVKTVIAPEDLTPEFIPPEPKKGLTALDIFAKNVERIAPGETKRADLSITWEGDTNLRVEEIIVDESTGLKFAFTQPIEFTPSPTGKQTSSIPYVIEAPATLCTTEQSANCVYNDATYELPTQVFATSNGEAIKFNSVLTINVTDDFNLGMQEIFLGILALVIIALIIGRTKKTNKRSKIMRRSKRPNLR